MRRLLAAVVTCGLILAAAVPALAIKPLTGNRLPSGITKINVSISFPLRTVSGRHKPVHMTLTKAATVAEVVTATNALPIARIHVMCPMIMRIGPELTVVFRGSSGAEVAVATVDVTQGSKGDSGSNVCFPIHFTSAAKTANLLGNSWVRLMGKLTRTAIS